MTQNPDIIKENIDKFDYIKMNVVANIINKVKIQLSNWVLIFAIYIIHKYLMFLKEYLSREKEPKLCGKMYKRHTLLTISNIQIILKQMKKNLQLHY